MTYRESADEMAAAIFERDVILLKMDNRKLLVYTGTCRHSTGAEFDGMLVMLLHKGNIYHSLMVCPRLSIHLMSQSIH